MTGVVLERHELLWVLEQCGAAWPYPLRPVHWSAETDAETAQHRARVEQGLRARGLLASEPARLLLDAGEAVADWAVAVDLVRRDAASPCAAVALTDGRSAVVLDSPEHAGTPVRLTPCRPPALAEAVLTLVPPCPAGVDGPWPVTPAAAAPARPGDPPTTRRTATARDAAVDILTSATSITQVGVADRPDGCPHRVGRPMCWLDGPRGRYELRPPASGASRPHELVGVNAGHLLADIRTVLTDAVAPRPSGRSTV